MKKTLTLLCLALSACYPLRNARVVDGSENAAGPWLCLKDTDKTNPAGWQCAALDNLLERKRATLKRELPGDPDTTQL